MDSSITCPAWCDKEHLRDLGSDPVHQRVDDTIPVVMLNRRFGTAGEVQRSVEACDLDLVMYQYVGDEAVWVAIVDGEQQRQRLEISLESAQRLARGLNQLLSDTP